MYNIRNNLLSKSCAISRKVGFKHARAFFSWCFVKRLNEGAMASPTQRFAGQRSAKAFRVVLRHIVFARLVTMGPN